MRKRQEAKNCTEKTITSDDAKKVYQTVKNVARFYFIQYLKYYMPTTQYPPYYVLAVLFSSYLRAFFLR